MTTTKRSKKDDAKQAATTTPGDPFHYFRVRCKWSGMVGGSQPLRPTLPDHLTHILEDEMVKARRAAAKTRPSEEQPPVENGEETDNKSPRDQWLKDALDDPLLDDEARVMIREVLQEDSPGELIARTIGRATTTFPVDPQTKEFCVPWGWWTGAMKAALESALGLFPDQAQKLVKRCVSVYPRELPLGTSKPDQIKEMNVQLSGMGPQQPRASIKRIQLVTPRSKEFTVVVQVLDSPFAKQLILEMPRVWQTIGRSLGVGGGRPQYGTFEVLECVKVEGDDARALLQQVGAHYGTS